MKFGESTILSEKRDWLAYNAGPQAHDSRCQGHPLYTLTKKIPKEPTADHSSQPVSRGVYGI